MKKFVLVLVMLMIVGTCVNPVSAEEQDKMTVVFSTFDFTLDAVVALEKGYFKRLGLEVNPVTVKGGTAVIISTVHRSEIDGCFIASPGALTAITKKVPLIQVSGIGNRTFDFYVLKDSPIQSIKDFEGKTIANLARPSGPWLALKYDMDKQGIKANVQTMKSSSEMASTLLAKRADVVSGTPYMAAQLGDQIRLVHSSTISKYLWNSCGWWFKKEYLEKNPRAVKKFVDGLLLARLLINENPDEAEAILAKHLNLNTSEYKAKLVLPTFDVPVTIYKYGLQKTNEILEEYGLLDQKVNIDDYVDDRFSLILDQPY